MHQHEFRDGSLMKIDGALLKIYDETGGEVMEGPLAVELAEDQQLMFVAAALYHDGFQVQFTGKGFLGSQIKSMLTPKDASFADRAIVWASGHLNELQVLRTSFVGDHDEAAEAARELLGEIKGFLEDHDGVESVHDWPGESTSRVWLVDVDGRRFSVEVKEI
jgi:hypothetical protein